MTDLLSLAQRCEEAAGPDRSLDRKIAAAIGEAHLYQRSLSPWPLTASLDAAMTLVPEGEDWAVGSGPLFPTSARVGGKPASHAATPALALCAAALRARATQKEVSND